MERQTADTEARDAAAKPNREGSPVMERTGVSGQSGTSGVSDRRRAELERMEADAGTQHEAADESVPQRSGPGDEAPDSRQRSAPGATSELDELRQSSVNPDIDKR